MFYWRAKFPKEQQNIATMNLHKTIMILYALWCGLWSMKTYILKLARWKNDWIRPRLLNACCCLHPVTAKCPLPTRHQTDWDVTTVSRSGASFPLLVLISDSGGAAAAQWSCSASWSIAVPVQDGVQVGRCLTRSWLYESLTNRNRWSYNITSKTKLYIDNKQQSMCVQE